MSHILGDARRRAAAVSMGGASDANDGANAAVGDVGDVRDVDAEAWARRAMTMSVETSASAGETSAAAMMAMGPQLMASYAAYLTYVQSQSRISMDIMARMMSGGGSTVSLAHARAAAAAAAVAAAAAAGYQPRGTRYSGAPASVGYEVETLALASPKSTGKRAAKGEPGAKRPKKAQTEVHKSKGEKICVNCKSTTTPFWRKSKDSIGPLCNACGLYLAKNDAPRPQNLWNRSKSTASENEPSEKTTETLPSTSGGDATGGCVKGGARSFESNDGSNVDTANAPTPSTTEVEGEDVARLDGNVSAETTEVKLDVNGGDDEGE